MELRLVFEIYSDSLVTQSQTFSSLVGAIWQVNDKLSFDAAARYASVDGRPVSELRVGMTFGFPLILSQPTSAQPMSADLAIRRSAPSIVASYLLADRVAKVGRDPDDKNR